MSKLGLVLVMVLMLGRTNAQTYPAPTSDSPTYFVLIQADDGQAFYIRMDNQLYSSSPAGHLILARLKDSVYTITVGFPGQIYPEQQYLLNIHQRDWALRLTRQDNRWGLFDSQGHTVASASDPSTTPKPMLANTKKDDAFSQMMSAIVQDTAVMYNTYAATPPDTTQPVALAPAVTSATGITQGTSAPAAARIVHDSSEPAAPPIIRDSTGSPVVETVATPNIRDSSGLSRSSIDSASLHPALPAALPSSSTTNAAIPSAPTGVVKLSEHRSTQSLSLVYADRPTDRKTGTRKTDTIDVVIPVDSQTAAVSHPQSQDTAQFNIAHRALSLDITESTTVSRAKSPDTAHSTATRRSQSPETTQSTLTRPSRSSDTPQSTLTRPSQSSDTPQSTLTRPSQSPDTLQSTATRHTQSLETPRSTPGHAPKSDSPNLAATSHKSSLPFVNSDCHAFATEYDVDKLRVRMLNADKDDDRILAAYKVFKTKCFSTKQVRALSEVFTTDAARFKFLVTAYPFVSDDDFPELVTLLSDPVYIGRFRTMTDRH